MEIKDFDVVRVGSGYPSCVTVRPIHHHENYGVIAEVSLHQFSGAENFVQLRKHNSDLVVAMFCFKFENQEKELGYWENSTVVWDSRHNT